VSDEDRVKWDERYRAASHEIEAPSRFLSSLAQRLPRRGRALDIAGGCGRNALWLAARGLDVTVVDISEVGLSRARLRAAAPPTLDLHTIALDLERQRLPQGPWDLVVCILYLQRSLFRVFPEILAPGGMLVFLQPTLHNLERHPKPPAPYLLAPGELAGLVRGLEIVELDESWSLEGFHEARLLARRPFPQPGDDELAPDSETLKR
jgi:SAM-dependent methyltransferase